MFLSFLLVRTQEPRVLGLSLRCTVGLLRRDNNRSRPRVTSRTTLLKVYRVSPELRVLVEPHTPDTELDRTLRRPRDAGRPGCRRPGTNEVRTGPETVYHPNTRDPSVVTFIVSSLHRPPGVGTDYARGERGVPVLTRDLSIQSVLGFPSVVEPNTGEDVPRRKKG